MIHAKDLMIGDWVILYGSLTRWGYTDYAKWHNEMERTDIHAVEPVPLTPEILEKNGFTVRTAYTTPKWHIGLYGRDDSDITLNIYSEKKQEWRLSIETNRNERTVCYINNIHELQHALRLCGIEKEIKL